MRYLKTHPLLCIRPHSLLSPQGHHTSNCPFTNINLYWIISSEYKLAVIPHILENKTKNLLLTPPTPPVTSIFQYYFTKLVERFANSNSASVTLSQTYSNSDTAPFTSLMSAGLPELVVSVLIWSSSCLASQRQPTQRSPPLPY